MSEMFDWYVGIDWASEVHQVCLVDDRGVVRGERAVRHSGEQLASLAAWLIETTGAAPERIGIGIELPHGPVDALIPFILVYLRTYRPLLDVEGRPELLLTEQGRAMTPRAIGHVFRTRTGNALGRAFSPHHVRTLYATDMASLSLEAAPAIRAMLGHSDPETLRHYLALGTSSLAARQLQDVTEKLRQGDAGYDRSSRRRKVHAD
ncbi:site-specific integrase [Skermanella pratensis]|uniref:site-specific integrase n=1 Tax=Skermanella pratensis TaxID=2233999 RepID=UPI0013014562|nr:site-specific integrase [Skermanella pratensis]